MKDNGGAAFPVSNEAVEGEAGMTLLDWFAGQALSGVLASLSEFDDEETDEEVNDKYLAERCYDIAQALIEVRKTRVF